MPKGVLYNYYPDPSYIKKKWKPEQIPAESLQALANAEVAAVRQGVLSPNVAQQFLPNALTEGWSGTDPSRPAGFGMTNIGYPPSADLDNQLNHMGLSVGQDERAQDQGAEEMSDAEYKAWAAKNPNVWRSPEGYSAATYDDPNIGARLAAIMLGQKAKLYGEDKAIERWNGQGPGALNHVRKVGVLSQMLNHPANKAILDAYLKMKYPE